MGNSLSLLSSILYSSRGHAGGRRQARVPDLPCCEGQQTFGWRSHTIFSILLDSVFFGSSVSSAGLEALLSFLTSWNWHSGWELLLRPQSAADNGECHHSWSRTSAQSKHSRHHCWRHHPNTSHTARTSSSQASSVRSNEGGGDGGRHGKVKWPWVTPHKINNRVKGKKIRTHTYTHAHTTLSCAHRSGK